MWLKVMLFTSREIVCFFSQAANAAKAYSPTRKRGVESIYIQKPRRGDRRAYNKKEYLPLFHSSILSFDYHTLTRVAICFCRIRGLRKRRKDSLFKVSTTFNRTLTNPALICGR